MVKKTVINHNLLLFLFIIPISFFAQQNYFQQEVNYKIDVTLNDEKHQLIAFEKIEYINKSLTPLNFIYFHLWPNAYKNNETALAKQLLESGETSMYFANSEDFGFIDSLNFKVNGEIIKWEYDKEHIDICKLILNKTLNPNDTIIISTPFKVQLPSSKISRLGHIGQSYAITQWYPKPAVFDKEGWHQMPYLNQGEFYSEFGSFDVSITLPKNYILAATGDRIDEDEEESWLLNKAKETEMIISGNLATHNLDFPPSDKTYKTISFKQFRVHDFAWFADKRFHVLKGELTLPNTKRKINTWAFFTNNEYELWAKSLNYINDATLFYSSFNGDYPYNQITAVDGVISAGGGMEYPNIAIIGECNNEFTLETTIMHEVGHNWFYGILGSNEREYPFLDEGLNSFYEMRYIKMKYPEKKLTSILNRDSTFRFFGLNKFKHKAQYEFSYLLAASKNTDQPIFTPANKFTDYNYGAIVYSKTALALDYLMNYFGEEKFDAAMRFYFEEWKFKHPSPTDLIQTLQFYLSSDLNWFSNQLLKTTDKIDYKIISQKTLNDKSHIILVKNNQSLLGPISISGFKNNNLIGTVWYNGFEGKKLLEFPPSDVDKFVIDANEFIPEINRANNRLQLNSIFKKTEPIQFNFVAKLDNPHYSQINYLPLIGFNQYNKFMLGFAFYNYSFLQKPIEFTVAPMFAFGNKMPVGYADIVKHFSQKNNLFHEINLSSNIKSFSQNIIDTKSFNELNNTTISSFNLNYFKFTTTVDFELKKQNLRSKITQHIIYKTNLLFVDEVYFPINSIITKKNKHTIINQFQYTLKNAQTINPYNLNFNFDHNSKFGKVSVELNYSLSIKNKKSFDFRCFVGAFVYGNTIDKSLYRFRMSGYNGYQDYLYDYNYAGRNDQNGVGFAQFTENDGAFKVWTPLGQSSKWIASLNIKSPTIAKLPIKLFLDIGTSEFNESLYHNKFLFASGIEICLVKNILECYIPVFYSDDIKTALKANNKDGFFDTMRFTLNLHNIKPKNIIVNNFF